MKAMLKTILSFSVIAIIVGCCNREGELHYKTEKFCMMPDFEKGYAQGVSACYAAATDDALYIAGGCNFPVTPAAEGGEKVYYKGIYRIATNGQGEWQQIAELPEESAYGACMQHGEELIIAGGMNSNGALDKVYSINLATMQIEELPSLPCTMDNLAGTIAGETLYVVGGNVNGKASNKVFSLELHEDSTWKELTPFPGAARVQPVCAHAKGEIYVWGGFTPAVEGNKAAVHCDGVRYDIATGNWEYAGSINAQRGKITLSGGIAAAFDENSIVAVGGVDKEIFLDAISGTYSLVKKEEYMHKPSNWYRFNSELLIYNAVNKNWETIVNDSAYARAGAQLAIQNGKLYLIGGELKPGIRTPEIHQISMN